MKRLLVNSVIVLVGFLGGGGLGGYLTFSVYAQQYSVVRAFAWVEIALGVSENEFDSNDKNASSTLRNTINIYDRDAESPRVDQPMKNALLMNRGRFEAQLSILEKEAGEIDQAAIDMSNAQRDLNAVGWLDSSEDNILRTFKRQPVPPCANAAKYTTKQVGTVTQKPCS
jgi:hypothetical protein